MPSINTMKGPVDTADLGFMLMHEHVFVRTPGVLENWPHLWDRDAEIEGAVKKLNQAKAAGVDSILDLTTVDLGRDIPTLKAIADRVDLNIIVATGVWMRPPVNLERMTADELAELFTRDIEVGIANTGVKAGVLKAASEPLVDPINEEILRGIARAHRKTGVPISTHTFVRNKTGLTQQDVFAEEGVDLERVIIGHSGDSEDIDYLEALLKRGSYIGMDRFGIERAMTLKRRVAVVARLCDLGYAERLVLSHDTNCWMDVIPASVRAERMPNWHYQHLHEDVLPALIAVGVTSKQVQAMTRDNPRRIFEAQGGY